MTLSGRNNIFKAGFILSVISLGFFAAGSFFAYPAFPASLASAAMRSGGIFQKLTESFTNTNAYAPFLSILGSVAYSIIGIALVYFFFEKTRSPEILFIGFFIISLSIEFTRILIPLRNVFQFPAIYLISASRLLLFSRHFGFFSLFAASIFSAGLDEQKQNNIILILILVALIIAFNVPIDGLVWDSSLKMLNGYDSMFIILEEGIVVIIVITFIISARIRDTKDYLFVGIGSFLAITGRDVLLASDTWLALIPGLIALIGGTWFICSKLHKIYLWL